MREFRDIHTYCITYTHETGVRVVWGDTYNTVKRNPSRVNRNYKAIQFTQCVQVSRR